MLARAASRRRLARSIAHLDDRLLADVGLAPEHRGLGDRLIRSAWATTRSVSGPARPSGGTLSFR
jgi:hypothetical protein